MKEVSPKFRHGRQQQTQRMQRAGQQIPKLRTRYIEIAFEPNTFLVRGTAGSNAVFARVKVGQDMWAGLNIMPRGQ